MPSATIVGLQWGDEGKGKVLDALGGESNVVVRFQGGGNAGHTVITGGTKYVFHLVPTGILYPDVICCVGNGTVIDAEGLKIEIDQLCAQGIDLSGLRVSSRAHVVFPYHKALDEARETARTGSDKIGTTKRGIGPCYADKASRTGIRIADLFDRENFEGRLRRALDEKNAILTQVFNQPALDFPPILEQSLAAAATLEPYVADTCDIALTALEKGQRVLFEGAQGIMLDLDHGTYPFVTSSSASSAGVPSGAGVPPSAVTTVLGIAKAYTTRVGAGPFPSELKGEREERLREFGKEYGATTGRPRRCGWLDLPQLRYAIRLTGTTGIVLTKLDTLGGFGPLQVVTGYEHEGKTVKIYTPDLPAEAYSKPVFADLPELPGDVDYAAIKTFDELPETARGYVNFVEEQLGVPVVIVSTGPQRTAMIRRQENLF